MVGCHFHRFSGTSRGNGTGDAPRPNTERGEGGEEEARQGRGLAWGGLS